MKESETFIASAAITIFLTGCIIIAHEVSTDFRQSLVAPTGNHWISFRHDSNSIICVYLGTSDGLEELEKVPESI